MTESSTIKIWVGRHVTLELTDSFGDVEQLELDLVADAAADFAKGFLGESTPLAKAILGCQAGDVVYYQPGGPASAERIRVRILAVSAELSGQPSDLTARREEAARRAAQQVDDTNARLFASSFNGKWGDYDPKAVGNEDEPE